MKSEFLYQVHTPQNICRKILSCIALIFLKLLLRELCCSNNGGFWETVYVDVAEVACYLFLYL